MSSKSSTLFLSVLIGAIGLPASFAAANPYGSGHGTAAVQQASDATAAQKKRAAALALKKKKQQQRSATAAAVRAKKAKELAANKPQQASKKKKWYEDDRDRGLDVAAKYAPDTIARVRERKHIAKGDTVRTGNGKTGWQHYLDKYYSR
ncbi:hypothetical protein [Hyphomicrobium sp. CS1GBMeth3]|uniref:hypothetical protein n=1 Tax=Hyphomicrobium sp. CS1GBMeth3 TaxID=1892845 RepID=UPI0009309E6B|nr:hypothetical protein [Hyphomicrobium sp. CS1GBMeth3]